jgi:hypothetical protein
MEASQIQFQENRAPNRTPVRQPGLVISGFGGLHAGLTGLLQIQPGDARALLLLTGLVAALVLAGLGYQPFYVLYRRYVAAWMTEINLQAMRGTEHMGERDSIGYLLFGAIGQADRGRASRGQQGNPLGDRRGVVG